MKENYPIYLPYQFRLRPQSLGRDPQLPHKKMKTPFLLNMSKSRRLTSTFFPIKTASMSVWMKKTLTCLAFFMLLINPKVRYLPCSSVKNWEDIFLRVYKLPTKNKQHAGIQVLRSHYRKRSNSVWNFYDIHTRDHWDPITIKDQLWSKFFQGQVANFLH